MTWQQQDTKKAKKLLGKGIKFDLVLLHTDGIKTVAIAEQIQKDLKAAGVKVSLKQVPYSDQEKWQEELVSGQHHLFLMGYKADFLISPEAKMNADSYDLIRPLFGYGGEANFTFFHNPRVDNLLNQISELDPSVRELREAKIKEISRIIKKAAPTVNLFYIPKL
jgi:ABC-type transport system substrate-binding protein